MKSWEWEGGKRGQERGQERGLVTLRCVGGRGGHASANLHEKRRVSLKLGPPNPSTLGRVVHCGKSMQAALPDCILVVGSNEVPEETTIAWW